MGSQITPEAQELQALSQAWVKAWPRAKTAVMKLAQPWAEVWTEVETKTEAEVKSKATQEVEEEALGLARAWAWARREPLVPAERVPSVVPNPSVIRCLLSYLNRRGITHDLWHHSPETRGEYSCIIHFITPITRLPFELLHQILLDLIDEASGPPLVLMLVCKRWHDIVTSIWGSLNLSTITPMDAVASKLEGHRWLDIVVDTDPDRGDSFTPSASAYEAIFAAMGASLRWRSLVVESFPLQADLPEDLVSRHLQQCANATMSRFTTFKIKSACKTSPLLDGLLRIIGTTASPELKTVEINSASVISFLAPVYPSVFHSVKDLCLDTPGIHDPVDLLPHLHQLESFTVSHLSLPTYHNHVDLPFVHTLRHLKLRAVSIQWMSGRKFDVLEDCTLIFPLHRHSLPTFSTTLPRCEHLTFQGYPVDILGGVSAHKLGHLSVTCPSSFNGRGNQQLVQLSCQVLGESRLALKTLHVGVKVTDQAWMNALVSMSELEELVIHNAQPSSVGARVFQSLVAQPAHASSLGAKSTPGERGAPLCPLLRRFGLKYDRWLRQSEQFDLIPDFLSIIRSRQQYKCSLESFSLWLTSNQKGPLQLVQRTELSIIGFMRLAKESRIVVDSLGFTARELRRVTPKVKPSWESIAFPRPNRSQ